MMARFNESVKLNTHTHTLNIIFHTKHTHTPNIINHVEGQYKYHNND